MKVLTQFIILNVMLFSCLAILRAEELADEDAVMHRLIRENWFGSIDTKGGKTVSLRPGDKLFEGLKDLLSEVLMDRDLKRTTFTNGDEDRLMVEIEAPTGTDQIIFRFRRDVRESEVLHTLITRVGGLVKACYFFKIEEELFSLKELIKSSDITKDQALIILLNFDYQSIKFTYDFYRKVAVPWSESVDVDPTLWEKEITLPMFLRSQTGRTRKDHWSEWLEKG